MKTPAVLSQQREVRSIPQPVAPLHLLRMFTARRFLHRAIAHGPRAIPIDSLDVIILRDAQHATSPGPTALQHVAPAARLHPVAETVDAYAPAYFRLIGSFGHINPSPKKRGRLALEMFDLLHCRVGGHLPGSMTGDYLARRHKIIHDA